GVQVEQVVAAVVVVAGRAVAPVRAGAAVGFVPELCEALEGGGLAAVELCEEHRIDGLAPLPAAGRAYAKRMCQQVFLGVDNVDQTAQALRGVFAKANVDVDATGRV